MLDDENPSPQRKTATWYVRTRQRIICIRTVVVLVLEPYRTAPTFLWKKLLGIRVELFLRWSKGPPEYFHKLQMIRFNRNCLCSCVGCW